MCTFSSFIMGEKNNSLQDWKGFVSEGLAAGDMKRPKWPSGFWYWRQNLDEWLLILNFLSWKHVSVKLLRVSSCCMILVFFIIAWLTPSPLSLLETTWAHLFVWHLWRGTCNLEESLHASVAVTSEGKWAKTDVSLPLCYGFSPQFIVAWMKQH